MLLNGDEALVFSRIRKSDADSDISRTRRQRQVITALIQQSKSASLGQLNSLANKILPYVNTNIPKSTILSYGTQAILQGWMNYPINQITVPSEEYRQVSISMAFPLLLLTIRLRPVSSRWHYMEIAIFQTAIMFRLLIWI